MIADNATKHLQESGSDSYNWGYELVCAKLSESRRSAPSSFDDLIPLFDYVLGHETCFLEFKATPFKPEKEHSISNPYGYCRDESEDDYAWNVVKSIIALANTVGGAVIIGVTDKGHEPIPEIAEKYWNGEKWDQFSLNLFRQIFKEKYTIVSDTESPKKLQIDLDANACEKLEKLCTLKCHHHKGHVIPVVLVQAIPSDDDFIFITEEANTDTLLVREKGDVGETIRLRGRKIRSFLRPDKTSYSTVRATPPSRRMPTVRDLFHLPELVGRTDDLDRLNRSFISDARIQWIHGDPGIGKTAFVQKYIDKYCGPSSGSIFDFAFFVSAKGQTFAQAICQLSSQAHIFEDFCGIDLDEGHRNRFDEMFAKDAEPRLFKSWALDIISKLNDYRKPGKILIVLDNVDTPTFFSEEDINPILSTALSRHVRICVTSRLQPTGNEGWVSRFTLPLLTEGDALDILDRGKSISTEREAAEAIVRLVNCNAWAINLIATQIKNDDKPNPYTRKFEELQQLGIQSTLSDKSSGEDLKTLYGPSIARLSAKYTYGPLALSLFEISAWFPQDAIPETWLKDAFCRYLCHAQESPATHTPEDTWKQCVDILRNEGLIQWSPSSNAYRIPSFGKDVLLTHPETYRVWTSVFEAVREKLYTESANENGTSSDWYWQLVSFIDLTTTQHSADASIQNDAYKNATEIVKWIASEKKLRLILRKVVENCGNIEINQRIIDSLLSIAECEHNGRQRSSDTAQRYLFFLSMRKTIAATWKQDIKKFREISQKIRTVFNKYPPQTEEGEIAYVQELISDVKQYDKIHKYSAIAQDLKRVRKIILRHKDSHFGLFIKSYLEIANIEFEFKKYRKARACLKEMLSFSRQVNKTDSQRILLMFYKEQLAYMHLCRLSTSIGVLPKWYHFWRASARYGSLIQELSKFNVGDDKPLKVQQDILLFKSHYFRALTFLRRGKTDIATVELDHALAKCNQAFVLLESDTELVRRYHEFNNLRTQSGIYRLKSQYDDAQSCDKRAHDIYQDKISNQPNLDIADLLDDYGNTYALSGKFEKSISYVKEALGIRQNLLPPTHVKILNSCCRLAYLYGITAMENGELASKEIRKLLDDRNLTGDGDQVRTSSKSIIDRLEKIMKFGDESKETFLDQLRKDEQKEEAERVRTFIANLHEKLIDNLFADIRTT